jgi:hypothetical protein
MAGAKILVYGPSGGGKSTSTRNLNHARTGYVNTDRKDLPIYGFENLYKTLRAPDGKPDLKRSNYVEPQQSSSVLTIIKEWELRDDLDNIVIDTITHVMSHDFMRRILEKGYDKFNILGKTIYDILDHIRSTKSNKNFIVLAHNDIVIDGNGDKVNKIRSYGKLMDEKVEMPSMFTTVLYATAKRDGTNTRFIFQTQADGATVSKTPAAFKGDQVIHPLPPEMPNDLNLVLSRLKDFREGKLQEFEAAQ